MKAEQKFNLIQKTLLVAGGVAAAAMAQRAKKKKDKADLFHALEVYSRTLEQEEADTEE